MPAGLPEASDDVTRLQRELAELRESLARREQELRESQAVANIGSWTTDLVTMAVCWSRETHCIFGTDPDIFAPTHAGFLDLVHPDDRAAVDQAFLRSLETTEPQEIEHRVMVPGARPKHVKERWQVFNPGLRIITSSSPESVGGAAKAIGLTSVQFISKPYSADVLLCAVGTALAK